MTANFLTTFSNAFSWAKIYKFRLRFYISVFPMVRLTILKHWFRKWLGGRPGAYMRHSAWMSWYIQCVQKSLHIAWTRFVLLCSLMHSDFTHIPMAASGTRTLGQTFLITVQQPWRIYVNSLPELPNICENNNYKAMLEINRKTLYAVLVRCYNTLSLTSISQ